METMTLEQMAKELKSLREVVTDLRDEVRRLARYGFHPERAQIESPTAHPHIYTSPEMHNGRPTIRGTGIQVQTIVGCVRIGYSIEEILEGYPLTRAQVYDALSYYYDHKEEVDKYIQANEEALWRAEHRVST